jgi:hypothetical protein
MSKSTYLASPPNGDDAALDQKEFLTRAKKALATRGKRVTWDEMAVMVGVEPRAMKTYRMPPESTDYRTMPRPVRNAIEGLVKGSQGHPLSVEVPPAPEPARRSAVFAGVATALAALVIRQAQNVMIEGRGAMISGVDRRWGMAVGLDVEDRKAMALVSRARLSLGLSDVGAEIHQLLSFCTEPLGAWLPIPEVERNGLTSVRLADVEERLPTMEAEELASDFSGLSGLFEEQVFSSFIEILSKLPQFESDRLYTLLREFAIRHPIVSQQDLHALGEDLPSALWLCVQHRFYEPLPQAMLMDASVRLCAHCSNLMKRAPSGLVCSTAACAAQSPPKPGEPQSAAQLMRLTKGLRQYWLEPGIDEIRMHDQLVEAGLPSRLYPHRDRVDIDLGESSAVGIDLKSYTSPELLGARMSRRPGGLSHYQRKWLVIPDWLVNRTPGYLERLSAALEASAVQCLSVSQAIKELTRA